MKEKSEDTFRHALSNEIFLEFWAKGYTFIRAFEKYFYIYLKLDVSVEKSLFIEILLENIYCYVCLSGRFSIFLGENLRIF